MNQSVLDQYRQQLREIRDSGLHKTERVLQGPQSARVHVTGGQEVLNFCANNYLGLSGHPEVIRAAHAALDRWGYGLSSVRFICGTQQIHKELERRISEFLGTEDTILYGSCFDANGGLFETLLGEEDAVVSDELNHASIIDGIRLCKAQRTRYKNSDMAALEAELKKSSGARRVMIATDGVFSMDGYIAKLPEICALAERYGAMLMVDDSHAVGFIGKNGRGTHEHHGLLGRVDLITGTLGKALGGASGGYTSGRRELIELLRQRSRPYLFSNSLAPVITAVSLAVLDLLAKDSEPRERLRKNTAFFRERIAALGFTILPGEHPIVPIILGDAQRATRMANLLLERGIYVIGFTYPVVPMGQARIRVQISAAHTRDDLEFALRAFADVRSQMEPAR